MNEQKIHELLRSYFDGATSAAEERELRRFFASEEIPDSLMLYRPMFAYFAREHAVAPPEARPAARFNLRPWVIATGIAASIAVLFLVSRIETSRDEFKYFVDGRRIYDRAAAVESAAGQLQLLAASMQKARKSMDAFEAVGATGQSLQQLNKISGALRYAEKTFSDIGIYNPQE